MRSSNGPRRRLPCQGCRCIRNSVARDRATLSAGAFDVPRGHVRFRDQTRPVRRETAERSIMPACSPFREERRKEDAWLARRALHVRSGIRTIPNDFADSSPSFRIVGIVLSPPHRNAARGNPRQGIIVPSIVPALAWIVKGSESSSWKMVAVATRGTRAKVMASLLLGECERRAVLWTRARTIRTKGAARPTLSIQCCPELRIPFRRRPGRSLPPALVLLLCFVAGRYLRRSSAAA
jgi:uncharacterized protein (DUF736 family)